MAILTLRASASIRPSRFVRVSGAGQAAESGDNGEIIGVSHEGTQIAPLQDLVSTALAADTGQQVLIYSVGEICLVEAGAAITAGNLLKSDAQGRAVPISTTGTTIQNYGAIALDSASAAGQKIRVFVVPLGKVRPALT